ncbi:MAG: hypothetical protein ACR2LQ_07215 [Acidimicrobiales bacterium]
MSSPRFRRARLGAPLLVVGCALAVFLRMSPGPTSADAVVEHAVGYEATVAQWTSWYGSYGLGDAGVGWCIDHGLRAPDPDLGYAPTPVDEQSPGIRAAVAWAVSAHGINPDAVRAAGVMLAIHDLMGAEYPTGLLDVDTLDPSQLAGFDGNEGNVIAQAQAIKADALAHGDLVAPLALSIAAPAVEPGATSELEVHLLDAGGRPIAGISVSLSSSGAVLASGGAVTGPGGDVRVAFTAVAGTNAFHAAADPPDPALHAYASTSEPAQRVAIPAAAHVAADTSFVAASPTTVPPTTTTTTTVAPSTTTMPTTTTSTTLAPSTTSTTLAPTTTTPPTTTTTVPVTTSVPAPTTTTTLRPAATTSTTAAPVTTETTETTTAPSTTAPVVAATSPAAPSTPVVPATASRPLPRTGVEALPLASTGSGLTLLGGALVSAARRRAAWRRR